jgi:hypothetical protein
VCNLREPKDTERERDRYRESKVAKGVAWLPLLFFRQGINFHKATGKEGEGMNAGSRIGGSDCGPFVSFIGLGPSPRPTHTSQPTSLLSTICVRSNIEFELC